MTSLEELAGIVEQAEGPDRELDKAIAHALGWVPVPNPTSAGGLSGRWYQPDGKISGMEGPPNWCASLDAAMSLCPEGWCRTVTWLAANKEASAKLFRADRKDEPQAKAATEALALTAACLRSRAAIGEGL
jgi:hypothetical protein